VSVIVVVVGKSSIIVCHTVPVC